MKRKILLGSIFFILFGIGLVSASGWLAGNGILWIAKPDDITRFSTEVTESGVQALKDSFTGLKWEKTPDTSPKKHSVALEHCSSKGNGWRLPNIQELISIISYKAKNKYDASTTHPNILKDSYWSSTNYHNTIYVRYVDFYYGLILFTDHNDNHYYIANVVCVHD